MIVLAVDTSSEPGSLALKREGELPEVVALAAGWHSTTLHAEIARLLARHGLTTRDIAGYGVTTGPGAFTGVRVGLTAIKGLAEVHGKPIVPVSTLETLAAAAHASSGLEQATLATILDARRGQVFAAVYRAEGNGLCALVAETVCSLRVFLERLKGVGLGKLIFCGPELDRFAAEIEQAGWDGGFLLRVSPHLAGALAQLAASRLEKGLGCSALAVDANYVRLSDAELFWKE